jgi:AraC-like DNA-binding protein
METSEAINILLDRSELLVHRAGLFRYPRAYALERRNVPDYDLIIIGRGRGYWEIEGLGRQQTKPGTVMLFPPGIAHGTAGRITGPYELVSIHFDLLIEAKAAFFETVPFQPIMQVRKWKPIYEFACRIASEWQEQQQIGRGLLVHDLTRSLLVDMVRLYACRCDGKIACDQRVLEVLGRFNSEFARPLTAEEMGEWVGLSEAHLRELFKAELGATPVQMLQSRRMNEARHLLLNTSLSVKEISPRVGYSDPLYFSRVFHEAVGMAPMEYRQSAKNP